MDDFGAIPNAPDFARYMAKQRSDGTWCVWDYRIGEEMAIASINCNGVEKRCRDLAASYNRTERERR